MATSQKPANDSGLNFEARLWAAAGQAVPAPNWQLWPWASTPRNADSFRTDLRADLKASFVPFRKGLATTPFNLSDWGGENLRQDLRWKFGMPPVNNATAPGLSEAGFRDKS